MTRSEPTSALHSADDASELYLATANQEVGDWVVQVLMAFGIDQIFGIPGAAIEPFYNALGRVKNTTPNDIDIVTVKHESAAAFAAEGYYRYTGKPALCCSTAAPGITNLITGIANAKVERLPILVITAQVAMKDFESGAPQDSATHDLDAVRLLDDICCYSTLITHPKQLIHKLCLGLSMLKGPSAGPVHFSFPLNILKQKIDSLDFPLPNPQLLTRNIPFHHNQISAAKFQELTNVIQKYKQNVTLYFGHDVAKSSEDLIELASALNWSILCSPNGKGLIDHNHPNFQGITGLAGHDHAAQHLLNTKDLIILLGTTFDQSCNGGWELESLPSQRMIQINHTPANVQAFVPALMRFSCNMNHLGAELLKTLKPATSRPEPEHEHEHEHEHELLYGGEKPTYISDYHWAHMTNDPVDNAVMDSGNQNSTSMHENPESPKDTQYIKPQRFIYHLNKLAGEKTPVCADCSSSFLWAIHLWHSKPKLRGHTQNNFHITATFGSMGWAIGSSLGIAQAIKRAGHSIPTLCITGDGSYLMTSQEIGTAAQENLKLAIFVLNNKSYGMVKQAQKIVGAEQICTSLPTVNFALIAQAHQISGYEIRTASDLSNAWLDFMNQSGPAIFDVHIDPDELPPFGNRLKNLGFKDVNSQSKG